jgi:hypothetical protein
LAIGILDEFFGFVSSILHFSLKRQISKDEVKNIVANDKKNKKENKTSHAEPCIPSPFPFS